MFNAIRLIVVTPERTVEVELKSVNVEIPVEFTSPDNGPVTGPENDPDVIIKLPLVIVKLSSTVRFCPILASRDEQSEA